MVFSIFHLNQHKGQNQIHPNSFPVSFNLMSAVNEVRGVKDKKMSANLNT